MIFQKGTKAIQKRKTTFSKHGAGAIAFTGIKNPKKPTKQNKIKTQTFQPKCHTLYKNLITSESWKKKWVMELNMNTNSMNTKKKKKVKQSGIRMVD